MQGSFDQEIATSTRQPRILVVCLSLPSASEILGALRDANTSVEHVNAIQPLGTAGAFTASTTSKTTFRIACTEPPNYDIAVVIFPEEASDSIPMDLVTALVGQGLPVIGISANSEERSGFARVGCRVACGFNDIRRSPERFVGTMLRHHMPKTDAA